MTLTPKWVISDTHFGHKNILTYEPNRLTWCSTIEEHDERLILEWNKRVSAKDVVLHLGDISLGTKESLPKIVGRLHGLIYLAKGNHDPSKTKLLNAGVVSVENSYYFEYQGKKIYACHKNTDWPTDLPFDFLIHGHSHGHSNELDFERDCGIDRFKEFGPYDIQKVLSGTQL